MASGRPIKSLSFSFRSVNWKSVVSSSCLACNNCARLSIELLFQRATEFYLLDALALKRLRGLYSRLGGAAVRLSNQDLVVDLMDCERHVVSSKLRLLTRCF